MSALYSHSKHHLIIFTYAVLSIKLYNTTRLPQLYFEE